MLVFVEGADGTGKSTLCQKLYADYGIPNIKIPRFVAQRELFNCNALDTNIYNLYYNLHRQPLLITLDRSFISDWVYRVYDGDPKITFDLNTMCSLTQGSLIIHCDTDTAHEDAMARGEDNIITKEQSDRIRQLYNDIFSTLHIFHNVPVIKFNWRTDEVYDLIQKIKEEL